MEGPPAFAFTVACFFVRHSGKARISVLAVAFAVAVNVGNVCFIGLSFPKGICFAFVCRVPHPSRFLRRVGLTELHIAALPALAFEMWYQPQPNPNFLSPKTPANPHVKALDPLKSL